MPDMDLLTTDGNAIAGLLRELFAAEMTTVPRKCQSCGRRNPIGAHLLHRGAGLVLRCPSCGDVAACIVALREGYALNMRGTWMLG